MLYEEYVKQYFLRVTSVTEVNGILLATCLILLSGSSPIHRLSGESVIFYFAFELKMQ